MNEPLIFPTLNDVLEAAAELAPHVLRTPVLRADALDEWSGSQVWAKAESLQLTGSFKVRGALNRLRTFPSAALAQGLITVSAGNAALGAAHAARVFGAKLTVVMPANAVREKLEAVAAYGATVVTDGITNATLAFERAEALQREQQLTFVHPFDDPMVVAGAATATLELLQDAPTITRVYVPCSGGGPLAGALVAAAAVDRRIEVVGVQPAGAASMLRSLAAGVPTPALSVSTVADGCTAPKPGHLNLAMISAAGVRVTTVEEEEILAAMRVVVETLRIVAEPSGAVGLAGLAADLERPDGDVGVLVTGGNVSRSLLADVLTP